MNCTKTTAEKLGEQALHDFQLAVRILCLPTYHYATTRENVLAAGEYLLRANVAQVSECEWVAL